MTTATSVKRHPIRGALWGLIMGVGLALILFGQKIIAFGDTVPFVVAIATGVVLGIVWSTVGPAKAAKGPAPAMATAPAASAQRQGEPDETAHEPDETAHEPEDESDSPSSAESDAEAFAADPEPAPAPKDEAPKSSGFVDFSSDDIASVDIGEGDETES